MCKCKKMKNSAKEAFLSDSSIALISSISSKIANGDKGMIYSRFLQIGSRAIMRDQKKKSREVHLWVSKSQNYLHWGSLDKLKIFGSISIYSIKGIYEGCLGAKILYNSFTVESSEESLQIEVSSQELCQTWSESLKHLTCTEFFESRTRALCS